MKIEKMIAANRADCSGCAACANICPRNAIEMTRDVEGFAYPKINPELCIKCGRCDATCPALNFKAKIFDAFPKTFAAIHIDETIRRHSSSGGAFTALSEIILRNGGVVFGAAFDENWHVFHKAARTLDELENLRGSKYVQSQIGDVYRQVKDALKSSKVLFSGTSCQCAGLKHFLGSDPENLLTVDIVCHGVPSPAVWEHYIGEFAHAHDIAHVNFKNKVNGWQTPHVAINFFDRYYYSQPLGQDIYGKLFLSGISERPSCHTCKFRFPNVQSDLTIGDAWGIKKFAPEMFDNRGTSLVIVHTAKGEETFNQTRLLKRSIEFFDATVNNSHIIISTAADERRKNFFEHFAKSTDKFAVMQYYFHQDDTAARKKVDEQKISDLVEHYQLLWEEYRNHLAQKFLVISAPLTENDKKLLEEFFESKYTKCGIYTIKSSGQGSITFAENFSLITFKIEEDVAALNTFVKKFNIAEILIDEKSKLDSAVVIEWLKNCGLPVKNFSLVRNS